MVWSNIPFKLKKINSFFDLYGNLINPHISFNMIPANLLRIWGWNFYGRQLYGTQEFIKEEKNMGSNLSITRTWIHSGHSGRSGKAWHFLQVVISRNNLCTSDWNQGSWQVWRRSIWNQFFLKHFLVRTVLLRQIMRLFKPFSNQNKREKHRGRLWGHEETLKCFILSMLMTIRTIHSDQSTTPLFYTLILYHKRLKDNIKIYIENKHSNFECFKIKTENLKEKNAE